MGKKVKIVIHKLRILTFFLVNQVYILQLWICIWQFLLFLQILTFSCSCEFISHSSDLFCNSAFIPRNSEFITCISEKKFRTAKLRIVRYKCRIVKKKKKKGDINSDFFYLSLIPIPIPSLFWVCISQIYTIIFPRYSDFFLAKNFVSLHFTVLTFFSEFLIFSCNCKCI